MTEAKQAAPWPVIASLDVLRPPPGYRSDFAVIASYSADLYAVAAAMLAVANAGGELEQADRVAFARAVEEYCGNGRFQVLLQKGRLHAPAQQLEVLKLFDQVLVEQGDDEAEGSWHPKVMVSRFVNGDSAVRWRLWLGSRNLTADQSLDACLVLDACAGEPAAIDAEIAEVIQSLLSRGKPLPITAEDIADELAGLHWEMPAGVKLNQVSLTVNGPAPAPKIGKKVRELLVVSPFLDGGTVAALGKGLPAGSRATLLSSRPELLRLAQQQGQPLKAWPDLRVMDAPDRLPAKADVSAVSAAGVGDEEELSTLSLHAKLILACEKKRYRLWLGSANATRRGWGGQNQEIIAALDVSSELASGLKELVDRVAAAVDIEALAAATATPESVLEPLRRAIVANWQARLQAVENGWQLVNDQPFWPGHSGVSLSVSLLGDVAVNCLPNAKVMQLPSRSGGAISNFIEVKLQLNSTGECEHWLMQAALARVDSRDKQLLADYLGPSAFLQWIAGDLRGSSLGDGGGDWDAPSRAPQRSASVSHAAADFPSLEGLMNAWAKNPDPVAFRAIGQRVDDYLVHMQRQRPTSGTETDTDTEKEQLAAGTENNELATFAAVWAEFSQALFN